MQNGEIAQCVCGLDGQAYCALSEGDPILNSFYEECQVPMLQATRSLWTAFAKHLMQYISAPTCGFDTIRELSDIESGFQEELLTTTAIDIFTAFEVCPAISCGQLKYKTCARVSLNSTSQVWSVNENACPDDLVCEWAEIVFDVETRLRNHQWGTFDVMCTAPATSDYGTVKSTSVYRNCEDRDLTQVLVNTDPTRTCSSPGFNDPACLLQDGSFAPCVCGLDGTFHCLSTYSDSQFDDYWNLCGQEVAESDIYNWKTFGKMKQFATIPEQCRDTFNDLRMFHEAEQLPEPPKVKRIDEFFSHESSFIPDQYACPAFTCSASLADGVCAKWNQASIDLNSNGCGTDSTCSIFHVVRRIPEAQYGDETSCLTQSSVSEERNATYNYPSSKVTQSSKVSGVTGRGVDTVDAVDQPSLADENINLKPSGSPIDSLFPFADRNTTYTLECTRPRRVGRKLKEGGHPKECTRPGFGDKQCELEDGGFAWCGCGMDGRHYCQVSESDPEVLEFWNICSPKSLGVLTYEEARFWYFYVSYFTYMEVTPTQTAPSCASANFYEFQYVLQKRNRLASVHLGSATAVALVVGWLFW